jgi:hypothetical protein
MLDHWQQRVLEMPFPLSAHGFVNGNVYLLKDAIRTRLTGVDPEWTQTPPQLISESGDVVTYAGGLAVAGVLRWGLGTGIIQQLEPRRGKNAGEMVDPSPFEIARTVAKAHKTAASDLLPRCALEFGIGAYLKRMPKGTKTPEALASWLDGIAPHWAYNGGGERVNQLMKSLNLDWKKVALLVEPGHPLPRLSESWLTEVQFTERLYVIADGLRADNPRSHENGSTEPALVN